MGPVSVRTIIPSILRGNILSGNPHVLYGGAFGGGGGGGSGPCPEDGDPEGSGITDDDIADGIDLFMLPPVFTDADGGISAGGLAFLPPPGAVL